jgi:hypothetical protein
MKIDELENLEELHAFPVRGAAVIGYFHERGEIDGYFYAGLVEQSGRKQFRLRWGDLSTEIFGSIKGKHSKYQYFNILGYIEASDYMNLYDTQRIRNDKLPPILGEPCSSAISQYERQRCEIAELKKEYSTTPSKISEDIKDGMSLEFIHFKGLGSPLVVKGASMSMYGDDVYASCDEHYEFTDDEESYLYVPSQLILQAGWER